MPRPTPEPPGFMMSMLDLLCSALGGVALLVFLFAAIRKNAEQKQNERAVQRAVTIKIDFPNAGVEVGTDVGFAVENKANDVERRWVHDDEDTKPHKHLVVVPAAPDREYTFEVLARPEDPIAFSVWLRQLDPERVREGDAAYLKAMKEGVRGTIFWTARPESAKPFHLTPSNKYLVRDILPEGPP